MDALPPLPRFPPEDRVAAALDAAAAPPRARHVLLAFLLALPVPLVAALRRVLVVNYTHHDVFIPLDAAWRTLNGQWPHLDYYTPLGLSYAAMHGAAAALGGMNGLVLVRANLVALPFVLLPALLLAPRRLGAASTVVLLPVLSVLVTSPVFIDGPERLIAHLANYNRIGGAFCALVALWALCPPRRAHRVLDALEVPVLAVIFLALLYLKVTFFALAGATALVGCLLRAVPARRAALVGAAVLLGMGALELARPGLHLAYLADVRRAGAANTVLFRSFYTSQALLANLLPCLLVVLLGLGCVLLRPPGRRGGAGVLGAFAVAGLCVLAATQNFGAFSPPLVVLVMLLAQRLAESVPRGFPHGAAGMGTAGMSAAGPGGAGPLGALGLAAVLLSVAPFLVTQLVGTAYAALAGGGRGVVPGGGSSPTLADVRWLPNPIEQAFVPDRFTLEEAERWRPYLPVDLAGAVLEDGLDLLAREHLSGRRIANLSFSNPFPAALRAPPPRGVGLWWDEGRTFTVERLTPEQALGDAEVVMVPRLWWHMSIPAALLRVAGPTLERDFTPHEGRYWTAWERRR